MSPPLPSPSSSASLRVTETTKTQQRGGERRSWQVDIMDVSPLKDLHQRYVASSGYEAVVDCSSLSPESNVATDWKGINSETNGSSLSHSSASPIDSCQLTPQPAPSTGTSCKVLGPPAPLEGKCDASWQCRKMRLRHSGRERRNASEREKLRMRGLAKALHNLRMYLPPYVVPAAQSLTKLETLRLAIRYIAHLTELLSEELPSAGGDTEGTRWVGCPRNRCVGNQDPPPEYPSYPGGLAISNTSGLAAAFQDISYGQSFTENNANLQLVPWFPWQH
ncbi:mesogenin-1-like [Narcine bancroftii]|uniref:mesogenin-1-like n=1 Tax=Narcine bancroftii TaxID=1343680 RepID=UPI0038312B1E